MQAQVDPVLTQVSSHCALQVAVVAAVILIMMMFAGLGYLGAALATCISLWLQFFTLLVYIVYYKVSSCLCCAALSRKTRAHHDIMQRRTQHLQDGYRVANALVYFH